MKWAWGCVGSADVFSSRIDGTPNRERRLDSVRPAGPAPTIATGIDCARARFCSGELPGGALVALNDRVCLILRQEIVSIDHRAARRGMNLSDMVYRLVEFITLFHSR